MSLDIAHERLQGIELDDSTFPLVRIRFGRYSLPEFEAYLEALDHLVSRPGERVLLVDCEQSSLPSGEMRRLQLAWNAAHRDYFRGPLRGVAFVIPGAVMRGVLTALFWVQPFEAPYVVVKTEAEGLAACHHWLATSAPERSSRRG